MLETIRALINKEIKEENEPKETAILIRMLCLTDILFLSINSIFLLVNFGVKVGIYAFATMSLMIVTLLLSYQIKMRPLVTLYYLCLSINVVALVVSMGLPFMFQAQFYIVFMIFFYRAAGDTKGRVASVLVSVMAIYALIFYCRTHETMLPIHISSSNVATFFCTAYIMVKSVCITYFFRIKFSASEEKIIKYSKKLEMLATTDPLTKLQNRRGMISHIEEYADKIKLSGGLLTIAIGDIDFFKRINDTYGHDAGDYVLETLAKIMNEFVDGKGMVARWGGEEFLFSFEGINGDYAFEELSKLLHLIARYEFSYEGTPIKVTMTFGIEEYDDNIGTDKVISKADEKLYMGKEQGRNRIIY